MARQAGVDEHAESVPRFGGCRPSSGSAVDLACGEGRNAVWLAEQGWKVTGVDFSPVGLAKAGGWLGQAKSTRGGRVDRPRVDSPAGRVRSRRGPLPAASSARALCRLDRGAMAGRPVGASWS